MRERVRNLGAIGLITDLPSWDIPPNAWTGIQNMRCTDGKITTIGGHSSYTTPTVDPYYIIPVAEGTNYYWVYCGLDKIYAFDRSTHTNITRQTAAVDVDYTGAASNRWSGYILNGIPVLTNGVDVPQMWTPVNTATKLQALTGWNANHTCKVIRGFKYHLFALDITKSGTNYPHMVKYSAAADTGTVPASWDETDETVEANEVELSDTPGYLVDAKPLKDTFIIYKEDSVYGCQYIGGEFGFDFYRIAGLAGAMAQDCVVEFKGGHFVVGHNDIYVHDGISGQSVIDNKNKDLFYNSLDSDNYSTTFAVPFQKKNEIWVCFPSDGKSFPDTALIWNYEDNTWYFRELPTNTTFLAPGILPETFYTWDNIPYATWDDWVDKWGSRTYNPIQDSLVGTSSDTEIYQFEDGNQFSGLNPVCYVERIGLDVGDSGDWHVIKAIYPYIEGTSVDVYVGSQTTPHGDVTWNGPYTFNPSTDYKIDCLVNGVLHGIRFQSQANVEWTISGYSVEYEFTGRQ